MWDWIMNLWLLISILGSLFPYYLQFKGKPLTWREVGMFLYGAFVAGMPFVYLVNR